MLSFSLSQGFHNNFLIVDKYMLLDVGVRHQSRPVHDGRRTRSAVVHVHLVAAQRRVLGTGPVVSDAAIGIPPSIIEIAITKNNEVAFNAGGKSNATAYLRDVTVDARGMLEVLDRITRGEGREGDIEELENLAEQIKSASLCGLGQTAPNPVLTTLRYFRQEYLDHVTKKECSALVCRELTEYAIDPETCNGCHDLDPAQGFFGTAGEQSFEGEPQFFKVAHMRNLYAKVGMFFAPGDQVRGFGFLHDGSVDTVNDYIVRLLYMAQ